jgi:antirestriction protein
MTITLYAQPYDLAATGFYFKDSESFRTKSRGLKNDYGDIVEEFEIQFIDGDDEIDCVLAQAFGINQANIAAFLNCASEWEDWEKFHFILAVGECGYSFDPDTVRPDDFDVDVYGVETIKELAEQFVEEGLYGEIPEHLQNYIDYDAIARDLSCDYSETSIAGNSFVYRCG